MSVRKSLKNYKYLVNIISQPKNYSYRYPKTKYSELSDAQLHGIINHNERFFGKTNRDYLDVCKEMSSRFAKEMKIPLKKVTIKKAPVLSGGQMIDGQVNDEEMLFAKYSVLEYLKRRKDYRTGSMFFVMAHENRHAYQDLMMAKLNKNMPDYNKIAFMRNEKLMRCYLRSFGYEKLIPEDDYSYNTQERDANYFALCKSMEILKDPKANISKQNLEYLIEEMMDFNENIDGKSAAFLQVANFKKLYDAFKNCIGQEAYDKLAKKYDLENPDTLSESYEHFQQCESVIDKYLVEALTMYYNFANTMNSNRFNKDVFDEMIKNKEYEDIYGELYNSISSRELEIDPETMVKNAVSLEELYYQEFGEKISERE